MHAGGRPLKFESVDIVQKLIDEYFKNTIQEEWTITGLALALDTSRETLINYEKREQFFDTIKRAKTKVEHAYEISLRKNGRAGDIFGLKNFGWKDRQELAHEGTISAFLNVDPLKDEADTGTEESMPA